MRSSLSLSSADPIRAAGHRLDPDPRSLDVLMEWMGDSSIVLIGEGSYGTHEFQRARMMITRRLIEERGFTSIALEADWLSVRPVNRFVRGRGRQSEVMEALDRLGGFPGWRWRNVAMLDFLGWLRSHNALQPPERQVGIYGLSLYGMDGVREVALEIFDRVAPEAAKRLRWRLALPPGEVGHLSMELEPSLKEMVIASIFRKQHAQVEEIMQQPVVDEDDYFFLVENARRSRTTEEYIRSLFIDDVPVWQIRVSQSAATIGALLEHQERRADAKIVVWGHNVLAGDARATEGLDEPPPSIGQLMREQHAAKTYLIGQATDHGTLAVASGWDAPVERRLLPPAPIGSLESLCHQSGLPRMMLNFHGDEDAMEILREPMLERNPGAVLPVNAPLPTLFVRPADQFDALLYFDESRAVDFLPEL